MATDSLLHAAYTNCMNLEGWRPAQCTILGPLSLREKSNKLRYSFLSVSGEKPLYIPPLKAIDYMQHLRTTVIRVHVKEAII